MSESQQKVDVVVEQDDVLPNGTVIGGKYAVVAFLAEGGMGRVYVGRDERLGRKVAIKVMRRALLTDPQAQKRFLREARAVANLDHPNTIKVYDDGEIPGGSVYIVMEFITGLALRDEIKRLGALPADRVLHISAQIAESLAEAHSKGVIHRDLKPDNIFLAEIGGQRDFVKVLDFGIAKVLESERTTQITMAGYVCGTPEYMAPEQARGETVSGQADIYSLGAMMYEMVSGTIPFIAPTPLGILLKHQNDPPAPLPDSVPSPLRTLIESMLAKDPTARPAGAAESIARMREVAEQLGPSSVTRSIPGRPVALSGARTPPITAEAVAPTAAMPAATPTESATDIAVPKRSPVPAVAGVALLLLAGGIAFLLLRPAASNDEASLTPPAGTGTADLAPPDPAPPAEVSFACTSEPAGAEVLVDNRAFGRTPVDVAARPGATIVLTVQTEGHEPWSQRIEVPSDGSAPPPVAVTLAALPARVEFASEPSGAGVFSGESEQPLCTTPCSQSFPASETAVAFRLLLDGYQPLQQDVHLGPGSSQTVRVAFAPIERTQRPNPRPDRGQRDGGEPAPPDNPEPAPDNPFRVIDRR